MPATQGDHPRCYHNLDEAYILLEYTQSCPRSKLSTRRTIRCRAIEERGAENLSAHESQLRPETDQMRSDTEYLN